ncbi:class I SAM-dependent methyltransferase [Frankia sp. AgB1.9]|uniref:class I SAM-dependent methyltransferase n=1 Tax=unclassified Frankia TaxID=2632575 RepID=UPI001931D041|nr:MULTISPECIES: class I SAM-dependent methyltransferase [unclassified Frankia]MBL7493542.1 class I SAM-dependent methyltransferase [Frankia sp. AgW1.1]MBL7553466.1 class I SAM-dependent methyltransferase [Frankia sp. AgB1.9]MBL7622319.1 class I SAM-dependent methyltransferase [Frankia sp. AgB1.8]
MATRTPPWPEAADSMVVDADPQAVPARSVSGAPRPTAPTLAAVVRETIKATPVLGELASTAARRYRVRHFPGSSAFWEQHYAAGRDSGPGSFGHLAVFKAGVIADICRERNITSVIEWGCGDGNQLSKLTVPRYLGMDVSRTAIEHCVRRFAGDPDKSFAWYNPSFFLDAAGFFCADLALSLDVIFHLVEDVTFTTYMRRLFRSARRHVLIYSSDVEGLRYSEPHVRDRKFSAWVESNEPDWELTKTIRNPYPFTGVEEAGSFSDFFFYTRVPAREPTAD